MKIEIIIPPMGESISEVIIGSILAVSGSDVKTDEAILEIETDKVNQLLYAPQSGTLTLQVKTGDSVKIGQVIASVEGVGGGEQPNEKMDREDSKLSLGKKESNGEENKKEKVQTDSIKTSSRSNDILRQTKQDYLSDINKKQDQQKNAAKSIENGRLDSDGFRHQGVDVPVLANRETRSKMSNIRKVIGKRLVEAQHTTAMLTTFNEIDLSQVIQLREKYKEVFVKKHGVKLGFMSFFIKATVSALEAFKGLNSYIDGDEIVHREYYDIGVAVGTEKGLIVPVVRNCDQLSFAQIESSIEKFAKSAKEGTIRLEDLQGGGFTITNGGVYGSLLSTPILNTPQSGILGMHKIQKRPVVVEEQIVIRSMMYVALSYDHRIVDGKEAVGFLIHIKNLLEDPSRFVLDV